MDQSQGLCCISKPVNFFLGVGRNKSPLGSDQRYGRSVCCLGKAPTFYEGCLSFMALIEKLKPTHSSDSAES